MRTARQLINVHMDTYMLTDTDTDSKYYSYVAVCRDPGKAYNSKLIFRHRY